MAPGELPEPDVSPERARPIPRISIQAFCEDQRTAECIQSAAGDRRLAKTHVGVHLGGAQAALANFQDAPTPNLIIVESMLHRDGMLDDLDQLASVCDAGTKVIVIGHVNDVILYRELLRRGVSEYIVAPVTELKLMESISNLYNDPDADPVGHVLAFVGAKGGVGSSTICHNVAWGLSNELSNDVVIADLDLPFGTAGLDFDKDPVQGIADALTSPDRLDEVLLDRLLAKCTDHLSLFASPSTLDRDYDIAPEAYEWVIDVVRQNVPYVAVDMPHLWTPWSRQILTQADEIVITVAPDLANLRNAKNMVDLLRDRRSNDNPPHLVINQAGMPKRPEIPAAKFAEALGLTPACVIEFDGESFGMASNNGQMIAEFAENARAAEQLRNLGLRLVNRPETHVEPSSKLAPLLEKFKRKK
ncbi:MAG: AAA family ATPase [Hyphomicrobiaceae bacterium]